VILLLTGVVLSAALIPDGLGGLSLGSLAERPDLALADVLFLQNYHPRGVFSGIGPAWSLVVEVAFYATLPLLVGLGRAVGGTAATSGRRVFGAATPALLLLSIGVAAKLTNLALGPALGSWQVVLLVSPFYSADLFGYGMLAALLSLQVERGQFSLPTRWRGFALSAASLLTLGSLTVAELGLLPWDAFESAVGCASGLLLAAVVVAPEAGGRRLRAGLQARPLAAIGIASYSIYLWHEPLVRFGASRGWTFAGPAGFVVNAVAVAAAVVALAGITYRFVEAPALRRKAALLPAHVGTGVGAPEPSRADVLEQAAP
jgi:peptidoglycan/LPS O-acetylase OafA/YrhL